MKTFLAIVGGSCLGIVVLVVLAVVVFKVWLRWALKFGKSMLDAEAGVPNRIKLDAQNVPAWHDTKHLEVCSRAFEGAGFRRIGEFGIEGNEHFAMRAFLNAEGTTWGIVSQFGKDIRWAEVACRFKDGTDLDVTTESTSEGMVPPPWTTKKVMKGASVGELLAEAQAGSAGKELLVCAAEDFAKHFEAEYERSMEWRVLRGGATADEVRKTLEAGGKPFTEEDVQAVMGKVRKDSARSAGEMLFRRFVREGGSVPLSWEDAGGRYLVVHEKLRPEDLRDLWFEARCAALSLDRDASPSWDAEEESWRFPEGIDPLVAPEVLLDRLAAHSGDGGLLFRVGDLADPSTATIWLVRRPEPAGDAGHGAGSPDARKDGE